MANQTIIQADPELLGKAAAQAASLVETISTSFKAIDKSLEEFKQYWVGAQSATFYVQFETAQASKDEALKRLDKFCNEAFSAVPSEYDRLETAIKAEVQKLKSLHS